MADGDDRREDLESERKRLRAAVIAAARALLDFEGIAAFSIPFEPLPTKDPRYVAAGTEKVVRELAGGMTETRAREILAGIGHDGESDFVIRIPIRKGPDLYTHTLNGDELEAIVWWMQNKGAA